VGLPEIKALKAPTITSKIKALNTPTNTSSGDRSWSGEPMEKMKVGTKRTVNKNVDTKRAARKTVRKLRDVASGWRVGMDRLKRLSAILQN
jgi:hypothetical protein